MKRNLAITVVLALAIMLAACAPAETRRRNRSGKHQDRDGQFLTMLPVFHRDEQFRHR